MIWSLGSVCAIFKGVVLLPLASFASDPDPDAMRDATIDEAQHAHTQTLLTRSVQLLVAWLLPGLSLLARRHRHSMRIGTCGLCVFVCRTEAGRGKMGGQQRSVFSHSSSEAVILCGVVCAMSLSQISLCRFGGRKQSGLGTPKAMLRAQDTLTHK